MPACHPQDLARLDQIAASVKREAEVEPGLTAKNRRLVEYLDRPCLRRLGWLPLPACLVQAVRRSGDWRQALAPEAVAVELLLTCTMRLGNLTAEPRSPGPAASARLTYPTPRTLQ
jgi:hypothetical protein